VSHSHKDDFFVDELCERLSEQGHETWVDHVDIPGGKHWDEVVEEKLNECDTMIVILSAAGVESHEVKTEWSEFKDQGKPIIPIILEECRVPLRLRLLQNIDFSTTATGNYESKFKRLMKSLPPPTSQPQKSDSIMHTRELQSDRLSNAEMAMIKQEVRLLRETVSTILAPNQMLWVFPKIAKTAVYTFNKDKLFVGWYDRKLNVRPEIDLVDFDPVAHGVSRQHALLSRGSKGVLLEDLGSTNGTFINDKALKSLAPMKLDNEAIVRFGGLVVQVFLKS
jgi:hypothetical protein